MRYFLLLGILWMSQTIAADFMLFSSAFKNNNPIPLEYSCQGADKSPSFSWFNAPKNTQSFALIAEDPDAPSGIWYHWIIWNIPYFVIVMGENKIPPNSIVGKNSWNKNQYNGPCPPTGKMHRYIFTLYALDSLLNLDQDTNAENLKKNMKDHILGSAEIIGTFQR